MNHVELSRNGSIYYATLMAGDTGNTFDYAMLESWSKALDQLPSDGNAVLVVVADHAKFFSAGIDLKFIEREGVETIKNEFIPKFDALLERISTLDMPTIAGINGHAYGGGALLATACDFRVMRADNGKFCFPEIDVKLVFSPYMQKMLNTKLPQPIKDRLCLTGEAINGDTLAENGLCQSVSEATFDATIQQLAEVLVAKDRPTYAGIKAGLMAGLYS